jgi:hypothetical protein
LNSSIKTEESENFSESINQRKIVTAKIKKNAVDYLHMSEGKIDKMWESISLISLKAYEER